ncbi:MAG: hypothetical protein R2699_08595 [Acidimicrobiales bacterium]
MFPYPHPETITLPATSRAATPRTWASCSRLAYFEHTMAVVRQGPGGAPARRHADLPVDDWSEILAAAYACSPRPASPRHPPAA